MTTYNKDYASLTNYRPIQISTSNPNSSHHHNLHHFNNQFIQFPDMQYINHTNDEENFVNPNLGTSKNTQ